MISTSMRYRRSISLAKGMSLIELMVSITIGFLVVGSAISIFLSNRQTYTATENVGRIQENMRTAYELVARDIREAGASTCAKGIPVSNVIQPAAAAWWNRWVGVSGFGSAQAFPDAAFGTAAGTRVNGTEALLLMSGSNSGYPIATHNIASDTFTLNNTINTDLAAGDLVIACNYQQAAIFQMTSITSGASSTITYTAGGSPGNCSTNLGLSVAGCASNPDTQLTQSASGQASIAKLRAVRWFIGNNGRGGRSLYQNTMSNVAGTVTGVNQEVAEGVQNMTVAYLVDGGTAYVPAASVINWNNVKAVRLTLAFQGPDNIGTNHEYHQLTE
jgi:type IV pilus assembly protein PilW